MLSADVVDLPITTSIGSSPDSPKPALGTTQLGGPSLDLDVDVPGRMFLRGRGLTSEWAGRVKIVRQKGLLRIEGVLRPVRGEYRFAGKAFRLTEGTVTFTGGGDLIPILDLAAEYTRRDMKAIVRIQGAANAPKITLTSVPERPQDEILSQILFGRNTGQLSIFEAAQLAQVAAQMSGNKTFSGGGLESVRRAIGTDVLRLEGGESGQGASATVGKYVTDEVYVGAKQGTTPKSTGATIEIELTPHLNLDSEVRQDASSRVGVKWKWDY
jgi:translocation and assembly module TamB